jgi:hypothetical protein
VPAVQRSRAGNTGGRAAGQCAPAVRAKELIGKHIGMFVDRSVVVNVGDPGKLHLEALMAAMEARRRERDATVTDVAVIGHDTLPPAVDPFAGLDVNEQITRETWRRSCSTARSGAPALHPASSRRHFSSGRARTDILFV